MTMSKACTKTISRYIVAALAASSATNLSAATSPFQIESVEEPIIDAEREPESGEGEGKEGLCGSDKGGEGTCGMDKGGEWKHEGAGDPDEYESDPCLIFPELPVCKSGEE